VDGFRFDAINFSMHDPALTDNPPLPPGGKRTRPFDFQDKVHNQSHADIPKFLSRLRALTDAHGGRFSVAEVGGDHADREMKLFTAGRGPAEQRLRLPLPLCRQELTGDMIPQGRGHVAGRRRRGLAVLDLLQPRRAARRVALGRGPRPQGLRRDGAAAADGICAATSSSIRARSWACPRPRCPFERLQDPEAIANWPQTLGRDGARTPMPWIGRAHLNAGFSAVEPWLPVDPEHLPLAVDAQEADPASTSTRRPPLIALRRAYPALRTGGDQLVDAPTARC
jgi:alpha-glucosidase